MKLNSIGGHIREYRIAKKLRQQDLAEKINVSVNYIGMIERGEKLPSLETLIEIINALGVSADMLLADVVDTGYQTKESLLSEMLEGFPLRERERIYAVIETMLRYAEEERPVE